MSPWELEQDIFDAVEGRRWATRQTWRDVMKESLKLWLEKHGGITCLIGATAEDYRLAAVAAAGSSVAPVESVAVVPAAVVPAAVVPAAVVPAPVVPAAVAPVKLSPLEESIALRRRRVALWRADLPNHVAAGRLKVAAIKEQEIMEYEAEILELEVKLADERAALSSESVGNVEKEDGCESGMEGEI